MELPTFDPKRGIAVGVALCLERAGNGVDPIENLVEAYRLLFGREPDLVMSVQDMMNEVVLAVNAQAPDVIEDVEVWRDHSVEVLAAYETGRDVEVRVTHGDTAVCRTPGTQRCLVGDAARMMKNAPDPTPGRYNVTGLTTDGYLVLDEMLVPLTIVWSPPTNAGGTSSHRCATDPEWFDDGRATRLTWPCGITVTVTHGRIEDRSWVTDVLHELACGTDPSQLPSLIALNRNGNGLLIIPPGLELS